MTTQNQIPTNKHPQFTFWLLLIVGVAVRLGIILLPLEILFSRWGSDDLFYYTQIAGHVADNGFFSFDGVVPTNGFQPLFLFALIPLGGFLLGKIHASLVITLLICTLFTAVAAWQIPKLFQEYGLCAKTALASTALFLLHPKIISVTFNGTEASLSFLVIIVAFRAFKWVEKGERPIGTALVFGALVLTRLDFSVILVLLFAAGLFSGHAFSRWVKVLAFPAFLVTIWLTINYISFGFILPSSGEAKKLYAFRY